MDQFLFMLDLILITKNLSSILLNKYHIDKNKSITSQYLN